MPTIHLRPRTLRCRLTLVGLGAVIAGGVLATPPAHADSIGEVALRNAAGICGLLSTEPTFKGVDQVAALLLAQGWTGSTTGLVMIAAVDAVCPKFDDLLLAWARQALETPAPGFIA